MRLLQSVHGCGLWWPHGEQRQHLGSSLQHCHVPGDAVYEAATQALNCFLLCFFFLTLGLFYLFIYLFLAVLVLRFCARALPSCGERGPLLIAVRGPLTITASLVAEHRLQTRGLSSCGSRAQLLRGMWDLPRPGLKPVSPALAGRLSTTAPPGKPELLVFIRDTLMG